MGSKSSVGVRLFESHSCFVFEGILMFYREDSVLLHDK